MLHLTAKINVQPDVPTVNGNVYPRAVLEKAIADFQQKVKDGKAIGAFGPCPNSDPDMSRTAFMVTDLQMKDKDIVAEITTLDTPDGKLLEAAITQTEFTTVGSGTFDEKRTITEFTLTGIAAVPMTKKEYRTEGLTQKDREALKDHPFIKDVADYQAPEHIREKHAPKEKSDEKA
jgi:hypothetical protein